MCEANIKLITLVSSFWIFACSTEGNLAEEYANYTAAEKAKKTLFEAEDSADYLAAAELFDPIIDEIEKKDAADRTYELYPLAAASYAGAAGITAADILLLAPDLAGGDTSSLEENLAKTVLTETRENQMQKAIDKLGLISGLDAMDNTAASWVAGAKVQVLLYPVIKACMQLKRAGFPSCNVGG